MATTQSVVLPSSFDVALRRLNDEVSLDDRRSFNLTAMQDVWDSAKQIERQLGQRRSLIGFQRIRPFLEGIEQYSKVIGVLCNQTPYLPFIWAPIKLMLQVSISR